MNKLSRQSILLVFCCLLLLISACNNSEEGDGDPQMPDDAQTLDSLPSPDSPAPQFRNVSVHDPSVIKVDGTYYVFGSHLAAAKTNDLMKWEQVASSVYKGNPLMPNVFEELEETFNWAQSSTLWAPDVIQLADGKFYMYYNACKGDSPRSALGVAVSDNVEGPYKDKGIILKSGMWGEPSEDGSTYDATRHPNTVDPHVFFDKKNDLWMVYGSYSGGIFIMKMDPKTGMPYPDQGYGKKLLGGNHSRIEGPYILYSPETDYYYLFLSYGGLDAVGGYNIRVARSKAPDGPYLDAVGNDMIDSKGRAGSFFDDLSISTYGVKLIGNFDFLHIEGERAGASSGYVSPGHNSAFYDEEAGKYYVFFHSRFVSRGEAHEVRVHQMFMNEDGWPVITPHRYGGETIEKYELGELIGEYKFINHGKDITADVRQSIVMELIGDGTIHGSVSGEWSREGDYGVKLTLDGIDYDGVFLRQYDAGVLHYVMTFSALSKDGTAIWGSHVAKK